MAASNSPVLVASEKTVTAAGTAVALSGAQRVKAVAIVAKTGNSGQVYVGGSDVASSVNDGLAPGDAVRFEAVEWLDLADIYVDADTNGEGVDFYAVKA
ncbi:MAG: hypothetical protein O3A47_03100 [Chloroflexi bacterium]|nr:hypothetical protein [Chloroflexota bacterium]